MDDIIKQNVFYLEVSCLGPFKVLSSLTLTLVPSRVSTFGNSPRMLILWCPSAPTSCLSFWNHLKPSFQMSFQFGNQEEVRWSVIRWVGWGKTMIDWSKTHEFWMGWSSVMMKKQVIDPLQEDLIFFWMF